MNTRALLAIALLLTGAGTNAAAKSLRPVMRPAPTATPAPQPAAPLATQSVAAQPQLRPRARPLAVAVAAAVVPGAQIAISDASSRALRPRARTRKAMSKQRARQKALQQGSICGDVALQGSIVGRVPGKLNGCGVSSAVKVRSISGVRLSQASVMDCGTARALKRWIDRGMKPAVNGAGGGVREIHVVAHYACRTRNNQKGARISEHGKGRAIDIAGFVLRSGRKITVLKGWNTRRDGAILRKMHKTACGPFGTVLGPNANRFHRDHFHFDTARYRSGSYCR